MRSVVAVSVSSRLLLRPPSSGPSKPSSGRPAISRPRWSKIGAYILFTA
jgi:hypothetical protein